jgi:hypothetical protein
MSSVDEKQHADAAIADVAKPGSSPCSESTLDAPIDAEAERKLVRKLDLIIFPVFFVVYMMAFLDRINISNANIQGLSAELHLDEGNRFNVALFVCYYPSTPMTRRAD